ncbi:MAG: hypothetical protein WC797_01340, partial [Candidatus Paceibacterota bacterium]
MFGAIGRLFRNIVIMLGFKVDRAADSIITGDPDGIRAAAQAEKDQKAEQYRELHNAVSEMVLQKKNRERELGTLEENLNLATRKRDGAQTLYNSCMNAAEADPSVAQAKKAEAGRHSENYK